MTSMGFSCTDKKNEKNRLDMVENQIRARGVRDPGVLSAMRRVPREIFVPLGSRKYAYDDAPISIGEGQTISQPYMVALMTECIELRGNEKVLEIGTGTGYQMAILLQLTPRVYSVERIPALAEKAKRNLASLSYKTINIKTGDGTCGWPEEAPFDAIIVTSGAPSVPESLKLQLAEGGRLVIPAGSRHNQTLYKVTKQDDCFALSEITPCVFVPLIGKYGWDE